MDALDVDANYGLFRQYAQCSTLRIMRWELLLPHLASLPSNRAADNDGRPLIFLPARRPSATSKRFQDDADSAGAADFSDFSQSAIRPMLHIHSCRD